MALFTAHSAGSLKETSLVVFVLTVASTSREVLCVRLCLRPSIKDAHHVGRRRL